MKCIHILGGGTFSHVAPHLAIAAPAFGTVAREIEQIIRPIFGNGRKTFFEGYSCKLSLSKMASSNGSWVTNDDLSKYVDKLIEDPSTKVIFFTAAPCDFDGEIVTSNGVIPSGKDAQRLKTDDGTHTLRLTPSEKIISKIRKNRKDIFLIGFKTTAGATSDDQYLTGLKLMKKSSCNLVLANDVHTRLNMVITPEQARYHETKNRKEAICGLVEMADLRSNLTFTRSNIVPGEPCGWNSPSIPSSFREVVDYCIAAGAYKPFLGSTVGHFALRLDDGKFLTSRRKQNFNKLDEVGLVLVESEGENSVIAHGSRPSVGGQSQRIVFAEHADADCIVHFHCPIRPHSKVPIRSQREYECGSHECGKNTSSGLQKFEVPGGYIHAVMLDKHGPNIVFSSNLKSETVIRFIEDNFDLSGRTDDVQPDVASKFELVSNQPIA